MNSKGRLTLSETNKAFLGVCGGIAEYCGVKPNLVRGIFAIFAYATFGVGLIVYVALAGAMQRPKKGKAPAPAAGQAKETHTASTIYKSDECGRADDSHVGRPVHRFSNYSEDDYFKESHKTKNDLN